MMFIEEEFNDAIGRGDVADPPRKKKPFKFYMKAEVDLLKEIMVHRPYTAKHSVISSTWSKIAVICGEKYGGETARRHFNSMMEHFKKEEAASLKASGTEEEFDEKMKLLQDISDLISDHNLKKKKKVNAAKREHEGRDIGEAIRDAAMTGITSPESGISSAKRPKTVAKDINERMLTLMETKQRQESEFKQKDLELQERKLKLEEEKWQVESEERKLLIQALLDKTNTYGNK